MDSVNILFDKSSKQINIGTILASPQYPRGIKCMAISDENVGFFRWLKKDMETVERGTEHIFRMTQSMVKMSLWRVVS